MISGRKEQVKGPYSWWYNKQSETNVQVMWQWKYCLCYFFYSLIPTWSRNFLEQINLNNVFSNGSIFREGMWFFTNELYIISIIEIFKPTQNKPDKNWKTNNLRITKLWLMYFGYKYHLQFTVLYKLLFNMEKIPKTLVYLQMYWCLYTKQNFVIMTFIKTKFEGKY